MKKLIALVMALSMMMSLAACGSSNTETSAPAETDAPAGTTETTAAGDSAETAAPDDGEAKVFVYGTDANSTTFDLASDLQTNSGSFLIHAVCEPLWTVDYDGNVTCKLAESYEWTGDLQLTIKLREGITFSNGNPLTASDVLFTMKHFMDSPRTASMFACIDFDASNCPDDYTVVLELTSYDAALFDTLGNASCAIQDEETHATDPDYSTIVGTGPYVLTTWDESSQYVLDRNESYWGEEPYYDQLVVKFYSEESTRYADFQAGNLDACYLTEASYVNNLNAGAIPGASLVQVNENAVYGFEMAATEVTTGAMSDINVRKAFALALDIPTMIESMGEGVYRTATSLVGEDCWAYSELNTYSYDPEAAAAALAEAGYSVENPLTIKVYAESSAWFSALFEAAQSYEAAIGINLDLAGLADFATILPTLLAGEHDMTLGSASNGSGNDPASLLQQFGPASDNCLIRSVDPTLVDLFTRGSASRDQEERTEIYAEFMNYVYDNYLYVPLYTGTKNYGVNDEHTSFAAAIDSSNCVDPTLLTD